MIALRPAGSLPVRSVLSSYQDALRRLHELASAPTTPGVQPPQAIPSPIVVPTPPVAVPPASPAPLAPSAAPEAKQQAQPEAKQQVQPEAKPSEPVSAEPKPAPAPEAPAAEAPANQTYTIKSGDTLSGIARSLLGDGNRWRELYDLNQSTIGPNPNVIIPGMVLKVPGEGAPAPAPVPAAPPPAPPAPAPGGQTHTVRSGETLGGIARERLGDANRWREIHDLNRDQIPNPNVIIPGMVLKLPGGASVAAPPSAPAGNGRAPYINQYEPAGAGGGYWNGPANCGPTSMAMIARAFGYGQAMSDAKLINHLGEVGGTNGNGTNVSGIAAMARKIGKSAETRGPGAQVDWIASQLRAGKMVVANGDYWAMAPHIDNSRTGGHYVAVIGLDDQGRFLVHDPAWRNGGGPIALSGGQLAAFINANPNGGWQISVG